MAAPERQPKGSERPKDHAGPSTGKDRTVRVCRTLFERADRHAAVARRSAQKQIELWAELGRLVEAGLGAREVHALLEGRGRIARIDVVADRVPDATTVLAELEADRAAGTLAASVTSAEVAHDLAEDGALRRHGADGSVSVGELIDGEFVERG